MKKYVVLDRDGYRVADFDATGALKAWQTAAQIVRTVRPRPRVWSLLRVDKAEPAYMGGVGLDPKRAEVDRPQATA
jgi:hypothetical protein